MRRNIIFLDVDGVLNNLAVFLRRHALPAGMQSRIVREFDVAAVNRLRWLIARADAHVVISSSWRESAIPYLRRLGVPSDRIIGVTPELGRPRGLEIQRWLNHYGPVRSFVILDDDADMEHLRPRLVQTSFWTGLQHSHCTRALALLERTA